MDHWDVVLPKGKVLVCADTNRCQHPDRVARVDTARELRGHRV